MQIVQIQSSSSVRIEEIETLTLENTGKHLYEFVAHTRCHCALCPTKHSFHNDRPYIVLCRALPYLLLKRVFQRLIVDQLNAKIGMKG